MANSIFSEKREVTCDNQDYTLNITVSLRDAPLSNIFASVITAATTVVIGCNVDTTNVAISNEWTDNSFITTCTNETNIGYTIKNFSILATYKIDGEKYFTNTFELVDRPASEFTDSALAQLMSNIFTIQNINPVKAIPISITIILNYGGNNNG